MNPKPIIALVIQTFIVYTCAYGQSVEQGVIHNQQVRRDDVIPSRRGMLQLTQDSIRFSSLKSQQAKYNFAFPYNNILYIRPSYRFIIPNQIAIRLIDGTSYRLFTYRKKEIIAKTREKMQATR
jgi:hypothetical protein